MYSEDMYSEDMYSKYPDRQWIPFEDDEHLRPLENRIVGQYCTYPKTRKEHTCLHCNDIIPKGTLSVMRVTHFFGVEERKYDRFHTECLSAGFWVRATRPDPTLTVGCS